MDQFQPRPITATTDGLTTVVTADTIEAELSAAADPQAAADRLVDLALQGGGPDNITVIVADLVEQD